MQILHRAFGDIVFAIIVTIFGSNMEGIKLSSAFDVAISSFYDNIPEELVMTVERLRYINTKFVERKNKLTSRLRGRGIAFK